MQEHFNRQADACQRLGSPFTARLCRMLPQLLEPASRTGQRVSLWPGNPGEDALALRLCGALHRLVLSGQNDDLAAAYPPHQASEEAVRDALSAALARHDGWIAAALDSPPQTNEIGRSAMLLPGFLYVGQETGMPLAIREIGASAGLNLLFDRFHYRYGDACWGDEGSPVRLEPETRGKTPPLGGFLDVASREASDIAPIDISDPEQRQRLKSFIWPDQAARLQRLDAALALADETPFRVQKADAADFVATQLSRWREQEVFVLFHSVMWQYLPAATRERIETMLDEAGNAPAAAPIAWLRMEPVTTADSFATLRLTLWPEAETRDLARCDYHGRWIEWLGGEGG